MIWLISWLEVITVVLTDPNIFLWKAATNTDAAAVNPNDIKMLLANGFITFCITGNPVFNNGPKSLPKKPPDFPILCNWFLIILY